LLEAELKGKLPEVENYEDVLTSNVFGTIKYLPFEEGLLPILSEAVNHGTEDDFLTYFKSKYDLDLSEYKIGEILFWPSSEEYGKPDLVIILESICSENPNLILGIEVKYQSHKSGSGEEKDQLKRYFESLQNNRSSYNEISDKYLEGEFLGIIYLTSYNAKEEIEESISYIENLHHNGEVREKFFRMRWKDLTRLFKEKEAKSFSSNRIYNDIYRLLDKKNLKEFEGIPRPKEILLDTNNDEKYFGGGNMVENKKGEEISKVFDYMIEFYKSLSKLYQDIEDLMADKGWTPTTSSKAIVKKTSRSIDNPHKWLAKHTTRKYKNEDEEGKIRAVLTYLKWGSRIDEPTIVLIRIDDFIKGKEDGFWENKFWQSQDEPTPGYDEWVTGMYKNNEDVESGLENENFKYHYEYKTIPLRKIENKIDIEKKIVAELLD